MGKIGGATIRGRQNGVAEGSRHSCTQNPGVIALATMSTKQQTLSWLAELPEESSAWRELHDDARLLRDIAAAEDDVRNGRERPLAEARELLEQKWAQRRSKSA